MKSIFSKIFFGFVLIVVLFLSMVLYYTFENIRDYYVGSLVSDIQKLNRTVINHIQPLYELQNHDELNRAVKKLAKINNIRITIIAADGKVISDSEKDASKMENHADRFEIIKAKENLVGDTIRYSYTLNSGLLYDAIAMRKDGQIIGFSRLSVPVNQIEVLISEIRNKIITLSLIGLLVSFVLIYLFTRTVTNPIKKLAYSANQVAQGNFNTRVYLNNKDELSSLANSFNSMIQKINQLFEQNFKQADKLETIFKSVKDGIIVIDETNHISISNDYFNKMLPNVDQKSKYFWELIPDPSFKKLVKKIENTRQPNTREVLINKRLYLASGSWIDSNKEIVVILNDIDEIRKVETLKKDFIANVSHELKTPLTAIKGFIETMEGDIGEENEYYLSIIKRQTDRLINIVQDLLLLAKVEHINSDINIQDVNIEEITNNTLRILDSKIKEKNLEVIKNLSEDTKIIKADAFMIEQVFINLIDNSIKYTDRGSISINSYISDSRIVIEFADTGIGMPEDKIERIFERFFTIDKSRSKNLSGTGLGLSIVKHIVQTHNGSISVDSAIGRGTKFKVILPQ